MRQGPFEVIVHPAGKPNSPFQETVIDGKTYQHAEPGEYVVVVRVIAGREHEIEGKLLAAKVIIDGIDDQTHMRLTEEDRKTCLVRRFKYFVNGKQRIYYNFAFPTTVEALPATATDSHVGHIVVQVRECELVPYTPQPHATVDVADTMVSENQKFWKQPTLCTAGGKVEKLQSYVTAQTTTYEFLDIVETMELLYHTPGTIRFLQSISTKMGQATQPLPTAAAAASARIPPASTVGKKRKTQEIVDLTEEGWHASPASGWLDLFVVMPAGNLVPV